MELSIITPPVSRGHSAQVEITLIVDGISHRVRLLGPDYVLLEVTGDHRPVEADLILDIDGDKQNSRVFLPDGLPPEQREVRIRRLV